VSEIRVVRASDTTYNLRLRAQVIALLRLKRSGGGR
jgi:hypothetical protein